MIKPSSSKLQEQEANSSSSSFFWFIKTNLSIYAPPVSSGVILCNGSYNKDDLDFDQITITLGEEEGEEDKEREGVADETSVFWLIWIKQEIE